MGPSCLVVGYVLSHCPSDVLLANRHPPVEILLRDRTDETCGVRIRIRGPVGRRHDGQARVLEVAAHGRAPLRVALTDQPSVVGEGPVVVQTSLVKQSAPTLAPPCARRKVCQDVGRSGTGGTVRSQEAGNRRPTDAILQVDRPRVTLRVCTGELPQWNAWILLALFDLTCRRQTCLTGTRLRKDARTCVVGATHSSKGSGAWRGLWLKRSGGAPAPSRQCKYPLTGVLRARHPECASAASCSFDGFRLHFGDPGAVACIESHRT